MKRKWILTLAFLAVLVVACGGGNQTDSKGTWDNGKWDEARWQ